MRKNIVITSHGVATNRGDCDFQGSDVVIPAGVKRIDARLFCQGSIRSVVIPEGVTTIGKSAFSGCIDMVSVTLPASVKEIADDAFEQCFHITQWNISPKNTNYRLDGPFIFSEQGRVIFRVAERIAGHLDIPVGVREINTGAFDYCPIAEASMPEGVEKIGPRAFASTALKKVHLPDSLKEIGIGAFQSCHQLESITIPSGVQRIGDGTFRDCPNLKEVIVLGQHTYLHQSLMALADLPDFPNPEVPLVAPYLPFPQIPAKLKLNAVLGFAHLQSCCLEMDEAVKSDYLQYVRRRGKHLEDTAGRHEELMILLQAQHIL